FAFLHFADGALARSSRLPIAVSFANDFFFSFAFRWSGVAPSSPAWIPSRRQRTASNEVFAAFTHPSASSQLSSVQRSLSSHSGLGWLWQTPAMQRSAPLHALPSSQPAAVTSSSALHPVASSHTVQGLTSVTHAGPTSRQRPP